MSAVRRPAKKWRPEAGANHRDVAPDATEDGVLVLHCPQWDTMTKQPRKAWLRRHHPTAHISHLSVRARECGRHLATLGTGHRVEYYVNHTREVRIAYPDLASQPRFGADRAAAIVHANWVREATASLRAAKRILVRDAAAAYIAAKASEPSEKARGKGRLDDSTLSGIRANIKRLLEAPMASGGLVGDAVLADMTREDIEAAGAWTREKHGGSVEWQTTRYIHWRELLALAIKKGWYAGPNPVDPLPAVEEPPPLDLVRGSTEPATLAQAACLFGVHASTIKKWCKEEEYDWVIRRQRLYVYVPSLLLDDDVPSRRRFPEELLESPYDTEQEDKLSVERVAWVFEHGMEGEEEQVVLGLLYQSEVGARVSELTGLLVGDHRPILHRGLPVLWGDEVAACRVTFRRQWNAEKKCHDLFTKNGRLREGRFGGKVLEVVRRLETIALERRDHALRAELPWNPPALGTPLLVQPDGRPMPEEALQSAWQRALLRSGCPTHLMVGLARLHLHRHLQMCLCLEACKFNVGTTADIFSVGEDVVREVYTRIPAHHREEVQMRAATLSRDTLALRRLERHPATLMIRDALEELRGHADAHDIRAFGRCESTVERLASELRAAAGSVAPAELRAWLQELSLELAHLRAVARANQPLVEQPEDWAR